ncbi:glycosyl hydrolase [Massilia sp. W12]|uniref:glycosyl hydrolase n=1 Tax=Massilia sp. W12 TaxID=3126507 RepID=UPI0030D01468
MTIMNLPAHAAAPADTPPWRAAHTLRPGGEREAPPAPGWRGHGPVPSNSWYAGSLFGARSQPLYALPLTVHADDEGLEVGMPQLQKQSIPSRGEIDVNFLHEAAWRISTPGSAWRRAVVTHSSDWALELELSAQNGPDMLQVSLAHGNPVLLVQSRHTRLDLHMQGKAEIFLREPQRLGLTLQGAPWLLNLPDGASWQENPVSRQIEISLPAARRFISLAVLPQQDAATLALFTKHAFVRIRDSRISWQVDQAQASVLTGYALQTEALAGTELRPLLALYPHHYHQNPALDLLPGQYASVRGPLRLIAAHSFSVKRALPGLLPFLPALPDGPAQQQLRQLIAKDMAGGADALLAAPGAGTYWQGKGLGRAAQLMAVAEQAGDKATRDALLATLKRRMESWFRGDGPGYFYYHAKLGTLIGYPDEYGSALELNDHHFHYGYWIYAAAQVGLRDPAWAKTWGGMVDLLVRDIANPQRGDAQFPFLRHFDAWEGHSWASGSAPFFEGNNQESSSEAIHAWAGVTLWGQVRGDKAVREAGLFLYASEIAAAEYYWFDLHKLSFPPAYQNMNAGIVWGGKLAHTTWFTEDPREIAGINFLPLTAASLYLGKHADYVKRHRNIIDAEYAKYRQIERAEYAPAQIWQDILEGYLALADPQAAERAWDAQGMVELGETVSHTYHWIQCFKQWGTPDFSVQADSLWAAVLKRADGKRTYLAWNPQAQQKTVRFSDGQSLTLKPGALALASQ